MDKKDKEQKQIDKVKRAIKWDIWGTGTIVFLIWFYFMNMDNFLDSSIKSLIISSLAILLFFPISVVVPYFIYKIKLFFTITKEGIETYRFPEGSNIALTKDNQLLIFRPTNIHGRYNHKNIYLEGILIKSKASDSMIKRSAEFATIRRFSDVIFDEINKLAILFMILNVLCMTCIPHLRQDIAEASQGITFLSIDIGFLYVIIISIAWIYLLFLLSGKCSKLILFKNLDTMLVELTEPNDKVSNFSWVPVTSYHHAVDDWTSTGHKLSIVEASIDGGLFVKVTKDDKYVCHLLFNHNFKAKHFRKKN